MSQTYFNGKHLVRWNGKQPNGMRYWDCKCPVEYVKLNPKDLELYEVHFCG